MSEINIIYSNAVNMQKILLGVCYRSGDENMCQFVYSVKKILCKSKQISMQFKRIRASGSLYFFIIKRNPMFLNDKGYIYEQDTQVIMIQGAEVTLRTDDFGISSNDSM